MAVLNAMPAGGLKTVKSAWQDPEIGILFLIFGNPSDSLIGRVRGPIIGAGHKNQKSIVLIPEQQ